MESHTLNEEDTYKVPSENKINVTGKDMGALYCNGGEDVTLQDSPSQMCKHLNSEISQNLIQRVGNINYAHCYTQVTFGSGEFIFQIIIIIIINLRKKVF